eukprot:scaffold2908_cov257-Pinguiococcus_pyrenoidosus.AAC.44
MEPETERSATLVTRFSPKAQAPCVPYIMDRRRKTIDFNFRILLSPRCILFNAQWLGSTSLASSHPVAIEDGQEKAEMALGNIGIRGWLRSFVRTGDPSSPAFLRRCACLGASELEAASELILLA